MMNLDKDNILYWPRIAKIPIVQCDSKNRVYHAHWRDIDFDTVDYEDNERNGIYKNGNAIKLGVCLKPSENLHSFAIDLDGWSAVIGLFGKPGDTDEQVWNKVIQNASKTRIEWHQNKGRLHIIFYSYKPVNKKKIKVKAAGLELRYDELLAVSPSINSDGNRWTVLGVETPSILGNEDVDKLEQQIESLNEDGNGNSSKIDKELIAQRIRDRNKIEEGERHNRILKECNRIIWENIRDYAAELTTEKEIWNQCLEYSKNCDPPLPQDELETIFKDAFIHVAEEYEKDKNNSKASPGKKKAKSSEKDKEDKTKDIPINKYHNESKDLLYETVYLNNNPCFVFADSTGELASSQRIVYMKNTYLVPQTDRNTTKQFYFTDPELIKYWDRSATVTISELYQMSKKIWLKYIDAEDHIITLCAADTIFTYFQDKSYITHYDYILGENDSGKSIYLDLMAEIGYRAFTAVDISEASLYRALGSVQEGQCIILLDEANNLSEKIIELLKAGYQKGRTVPRSDTEVEGRRMTESYFIFGFKMMASELGPDGAGLKGFNERVFRIKAMVGFPEMALRDVLEDKKIYKEEWTEIEDFRKLMFCWRLRHYNDVLVTPKMNVRNRDKELVKPLLKLFSKTDVMPELVKALSLFLKYRRESKSDSFEAAIYKCVYAFVDKDPDAWSYVDPETREKFEVDLEVSKYTIPVPGTAFTDYLVNNNDGQYEKKRGDTENKLSIEFPYFGKMSHKDISKTLHDRFGAERIQKHRKWCYEFNIERITRLAKTYAAFEGLEVNE